jgi:hypothetical protein
VDISDLGALTGNGPWLYNQLRADVHQIIPRAIARW